MRFINPKSFLDYFKKSSIQYLISISFTSIAVAGMIFIGMSLFLRFTASNEAIISKYNKRVIEQVNMNIDRYLRSMMKISDTMYYRVIKNADFARESVSKEMSLLYETNRDQIVSIAVFSQDGSLLDAVPLDTLKKMVNPQTQDWYINALNQIENFHFSIPHVQNLFDDLDNKYRWVVSLSRAVEITKNGGIEGGVLLVDMNFSAIEQICQGVDLGTSGYIYLMDSEGEIIYHPRQELIYSNLASENNYTAVNYEDGNHKEIFEDEQRLVTVKTVGYTGWKLVGITPMKDILADNYQIRIFMAFIVLFTILLMIFINLFVSSKIADPIKALEMSVNDLDSSLENVNIAVGGSYEIVHLGQTIKAMAEKMKKLMQDIVIEQESKRKSELDALQAQINPHFLYNTLDSIVWMIENERYEEAIKMVTSFASFFRVSLSKGKNIISVANELKHVENYMTIQHMRFKNKFVFKIDAEKETLNFATIKLIIQPIVENAIYHGMEFMDGDGEIKINSYVHENDLYIDVVDNGLGMTEDIVERLLIHESKTRGKGSGIGLKNVQERIQLYFGKDYGLKIISEPDEGTTVRVHLPCIDINSVDEKDGKFI